MLAAVLVHWARQDHGQAVVVNAVEVMNVKALQGVAVVVLEQLPGVEDFALGLRQMKPPVAVFVYVQDGPCQAVRHVLPNG